MTFNLDAILDDSNLDTPDTRRFLSALQANILKGHGRHHIALLFLEITEVAHARAFLHQYKVTDADTQFRETNRFKDTGEPGGLVQLVFISHAGLVKLGKAAAFKSADGEALDPFFEGGMAADTEVLDQQTTASWQSAFAKPVDVLLLLAHDDDDDLARTTSRSVGALEKANSGFTVLFTQEGRAYFNSAKEGIEHFGYVDGRSQPLMIKSDLVREKGTRKKFVYDPESPLKQFMFQDPLAPDDGLASLFVFRKLEQDVAGFKHAEQLLQDRIRPVPRNKEIAGARVVGRFENGVPVTMSPAPKAHPVTNDFDYSHDEEGERCPFQGHIRKTNPRGSSPGKQPFDKSVQMARRGIPYGLRMQDPDTAEFVDKPNDGVGLLFMSYQASIARQFRFMQVQWANDRKFPKLGEADAPVGIDPIIGQPRAGNAVLAETDHVWPGIPTPPPSDFNGFVHLKGGEYFYTPSPQGLKNL